MAVAFDYLLTFAGVPFVTDEAQAVRLHFPTTPGIERDEAQLAVRKHQPNRSLIDELNRLSNLRYLQDFLIPGYPGRRAGGLAHHQELGPFPGPEHGKIGDWYYPAGARRWSVFRGLATSSQVRDMLDASRDGLQARPFVMRASPKGAVSGRALDYTLTSSMFLLPPRPLAELNTTTSGLDGLFLVTLVDERYHWKDRPVTLRVTHASTWTDLIGQLATTLNVTITPGSIDAAFSRPQPDSPLWCADEPAAVVLDALAINVGKTLVRNLNGTYALLTADESRTRVLANRNLAQRVPSAGGDLRSDDPTLPAGSRFFSINPVVPATVRVSFPGYVMADPVPHLVNERYRAPRPSAWHEEGYGHGYSVDVPIGSGGTRVTSVSGVGTLVVQDSAKALYSGEADIATSPLNASGLTALAMAVAKDVYDGRAAAAFDEVYPGTLALSPDGEHEIVWSYSTADRQAVTRFFKAQWNDHATERQHAEPALSGQTICPIGVGGRSVAQTWRDFYSGSVSTQLAADLSSGGTTITLAAAANLPTQNRWRGLIDNERVYLEGTSGGTGVTVAFRGIDGSVQTAHNSGATLTLVTPDTAYGVNLVTFEKGQYVYPHEWSSGGVQGVRVVPQTQTIKVLSDSASTINGVSHYSGMLLVYDTAQGSPQYEQRERVWVFDRNNAVPASGIRYDGQFVGFSAGTNPAPVYAISTAQAGSTPPPPGDDVCPVWYTGYLHLGAVSVAVGDTPSPGAQIGTLGTYATGAHLHFSLGDGQNLMNAADSSFVGQTTEVAEWFNLPIYGSYNPAASPPLASLFDDAELAAIRAHTRFPLTQGLGWIAVRGSQLHRAYEYYAQDITIPPINDQGEFGQPVYLAVKGGVTSRVIHVQNLGAAGYAVVVCHYLNGCPASCTGSGSGGSGGGILPDLEDDDVPTLPGVWVVTNVCPTFCDQDSGSACPQVMTGISVEYRFITLPPGASISDPMCEDDPDNCCESGSGSGSGSGDPPIHVDCCPNNLPSTLYATFAGGTNDCTCFNGLTVTLNWSQASQCYTGTASTTCQVSALEVSLCCVNGYWELNSTGGVFTPDVLCVFSGVTSATSCQPLLIEYPDLPVNGCCTGTVDVTITE